MGIARIGSTRFQKGDGMTKDHRAFGVHPSIPFRFFSKSELAKMLGCTVRTIDRLIAAGRIPHVRFPTGRGDGHKIRFDSRDIEKWIHEHRQGAKGEDDIDSPRS